MRSGGDRFVSESALTSRIRAARKAVGDDGRRQEIIRTVHGTGYRFVADIETSTSGAPVPEPNQSEVGLPPPGNELIGRDAEMVEVLRLLEASSLLTILGPGGVGKTTLAREVARLWGQDTAEKVVMVHLSPLSDPAQVLPAVGAAVGIGSVPSNPLAAVQEVARHQPLLIVLDNLEHLLGAASDVSELASIEAVRLLVTSRERLRLGSERIFELEPLRVSGDAEVGDGEGRQTPAVELFVRAARTARPDFVGSAEELEDVRAICEGLDGLPLAVELAAAQLRYVPLGYLRTHMGVNAALGGDELRDRPARHNSVTDTVEWSYRLLTPSEQRLLRCLSVLPGAWSLDDAAAVSEVGDPAATLRGVVGLVDKSLVVRAESTPDEPGFAMLHVIREYASDKLEESLEARDTRLRHADHVATVTRDFEQRWWSDVPRDSIGKFGDRYPSVLDALEFSFSEGDALVGAAITADLHFWWPRSGHHVDGRRFSSLALDHIEDLDESVAARLNLCVGMLAFMKRDLDTARERWSLALDQTLDEPDGRYHTLAICDLAATSIGRSEELEDALRMAADGVARARVIGEARLLASCLNVYGEISRVGNRLDLAKAAYVEALELNRDLGDHHNFAIVEANLGHVATALGRYQEALRAFSPGSGIVPGGGRPGHGGVDHFRAGTTTPRCWRGRARRVPGGRI